MPQHRGPFLRVGCRVRRLRRTAEVRTDLHYPSSVICSANATFPQGGEGFIDPHRPHKPPSGEEGAAVGGGGGEYGENRKLPPTSLTLGHLPLWGRL